MEFQVTVRVGGCVLSDLNERQQKIVALREAGKRRKQIAAELGISEKAVNSSIERIDAKNKRPVIQRRTVPIEREDPEAAAAIEELSNPSNRRIVDAAKESGLEPHVVMALLKRLDSTYLPVKRELERVNTGTMVKEFENASLRAVQAITPEKLEESSAYHLALISAILFDKRELADGRPTDRVSHEDRRKLPELLAAVMVDSHRRGYEVEINPDTGKASLVDQENLPAEVRSHRKRLNDIIPETTTHPEGGR